MVLYDINTLNIDSGCSFNCSHILFILFFFIKVKVGRRENGRGPLYFQYNEAQMCQAEFLSACKNMTREEVWAVCEMGKYEEIRIEERRICEVMKLQK